MIKNLIIKVSNSNNKDILKYICRIVSKLKFELDEQILGIIIDIVIKNIENSKSNFKNYNEIQKNLIEDLPSLGLEAIGNIISYNEICFNKIEIVVDKCINCNKEQIETATLFILYSYHKYNAEWIEEKILYLYEKNRILGYDNTKNILINLYDKNFERVKNIAKNLYNSKYENICKVGSSCIAELYLLKNEFIDIIDEYNFNKIQYENILNMFKFYFDKDDYNEKIKTFICKYNSNNIDFRDYTERFISNLFFYKYINLERDKDFILNLLENYRLNIELYYSFLKYIEKNSNDLSYFKDIILKTIKRYIEDSKENINKKEVVYYF